MLPYGIIVKQNKIAMQQSLMVWQRKYGLLRPGKFLSVSAFIITLFVIIFSTVLYVTEKEFSVYMFASELIMSLMIVITFMFLTAVKTVREYATNMKETKIQLILREETVEITTEFSKEVVPYNEIDLCYEKDFLLTLIYDKNNFPVSLSKTSFEKGNYDTFCSLLKCRIPNKYEKRGENWYEIFFPFI